MDKLNYALKLIEQLATAIANDRNSSSELIKIADYVAKTAQQLR